MGVIPHAVFNREDFLNLTPICFPQAAESASLYSVDGRFPGKLDVPEFPAQFGEEH